MSTAVEVIQPQPLQVVQALPQTSIGIIESLSTQVMTARINAITQFQSLVHSKLIKDVDYGVIQGCGDKPTLLKPGAEKVVILLGLTSDYVLLEKKEDFEAGFFYYLIKCNLYANGNLITQGVGSANTKEKKFASEWVNDKKVPEGIDKSTLECRELEGKYGKYKQYKIEADGNSKANTILKMAKKRALVDAALMVGGLSQLFTQDIEDMAAPAAKTPDVKPAKEAKKPAPKKEETQKTMFDDDVPPPSADDYSYIN